jgi:uncharacterized protein YqjF (DUF2071 family)
MMRAAIVGRPYSFGRMHFRLDHPSHPRPAPKRPWAMRMNWHELLFMHWRVPVKSLRPHVPSTLDIETYDGSAWLGVVPFRMTGVRPRFVPPVPGLSAFPELNVRTYVIPAKSKNKPGVWFFSLDATSWLAVRAARWSYYLPYFDARISCAVNGSVNTPTVHYSSKRTHQGAPPAELDMEYRPTAPVFHAKPGSLDHFLTERYCLYSANPRGKVFRCEIAHDPWPLQPATAKVRRNTMSKQLDIELPEEEPLLHYADYQEVAAWKPVAL